MSAESELPQSAVPDSDESVLRSRRRALGFVLITIFIDTMGIGIIIPVIPKLLLELVGGTLGSVAIYGGWLMFLFAGLQFVTAPVLGSLSDSFGRRPVLLVSLAVYGLDFIIMGWAPTIVWLFVGRALSGIFGATYVVASAYITDVTTMEHRSRSFGWMGAAFGLGFVIGPAIGGILGDDAHRLPFFVAAGLAAANVVYGYFVLPESLDPANRRPFSLRRAHAVGALRRLFRYPVVGGLLAALLLFNVAHDANPATWTFATMDKFGWTAFDVGLSMTFMGICVALSQGVILGPALRLLGEHRSIVVGFTLVALSFLGYAFAQQGWIMYLWMVPYALGSIAGPATTAVLSKQVPASFQGELQGALSALRSITSCIAPLLMTGLFSYFTRPEAPVHFPGVSFLAASILTFGTLVGVIGALRRVRNAA
ncbi:MAG: MFS transporter [Chromatiales bacterium]|nr:MAG: MFS transporter [Chromatiales bacterium]